MTQVLSARHRRHERMVRGEAHPEHGKASTYSNWMCRCGPCSEAYAEDQRIRRRRAKLNPPVDLVTPPVTDLERVVAERGACRGDHRFVQPPHNPRGWDWWVAALRPVCEGCPVLTQCREWVDTYEQVLEMPAFAAGETPMERHRRRGW